MGLTRAKSKILLLTAGIVVGSLAAIYGGGGFGKSPETEASLRAALKAHPKDAGINERLGNLLVKQGQADQAIPLYETAIANAPDITTAPVSLAAIMAAKGRSLDAQKLLERSLKAHPGDPATNEALGDLVVKSLGEVAYPLVQPMYETAVAKEPWRPGAALGLSKIYRSQGLIAAAEAMMDKAVKNNLGNAEMQLELAGLQAVLHKFDDAGKHYDIATALRPKDADGWAAWGLMLLDAENGRLAEEKFRKAVDLQRTSPKYRVYLGQALRQQKKLKAAMDEFDSAIGLDEKYAPAHYEAGVTFNELHLEADVVRCMRAALEADHHYTLAKVMLSRVLVSSDDPERRNPVEAMVLLGQAVAETKEQDLSVLVAYADALGRVASREEEFRDQFYRQAIEEVDKAIALGKKVGLSPQLSEMLLQYRQVYLIATLPQVEGNSSPLSVVGMKVHDSMDDPLPESKQPPVESLLTVGVDLSMPPRTDNPLDKILMGGGPAAEGPTP